nr:unnamed protein product [Spirometra erinaceieuropaei]
MHFITLLLQSSGGEYDADAAAAPKKSTLASWDLFFPDVLFKWLDQILDAAVEAVLGSSVDLLPFCLFLEQNVISLIMSDLEGIKSFLYAWLQKNQRKTPEYTFLQRSVGRGKLRFICELRVDGIDYVGVGNSANKKDSQTNAARDFANYLVRQKLLDEAQLPCVLPSEYSGGSEAKVSSYASVPDVQLPPQSMPLLGMKRPFEPRAMGPGDNYINRIFDQKKLEEAEEVDFTADIHGGWSLENAKARLNEYLQATRQQIGQVKYTAVGPDHNRSFLAESTVFAKRLNKQLYARETGSNKVMASRACCLSLVRQLYHAGEIEAYTGEKRKRKSDEVPPTEFDLEPLVEQRLDSLLGKLGLEPNLEPPAPDPNSSEEHNMIVHYKLADFEPQERQSAQSVAWCPPTPNWNPWTSCNIDEGPEANYFLEDCVNMINYVPPPMDERKKKKRKMEDEAAADAEENCNLICPPEYPPLVARSLREMPEKEIPFTLIAGLLDHICAMNIEGAVLIFLPGWNVISTLKKFLQTHPRYSRSEYLILPLHSQVPREDQRIVFRPAPKGVRKIVLSTNIAESSITINDVVFVIDSCLARIKMFTARNNLTSYSTVWASKTNLEQRRGRAGRVQAGFAFHLCSRARFERLEPHATPEILRTPLHELALMIKLIRLGDVSAFLKKAIQPPPLDAVIEAEYTLREMKALDQNDELTPLGQILARLPLEPRLGRMLVFACAFGLGGAMALLAAHASLGSDPFVMPPDRRRLSNDQLRFEARTNSDHLAALNVFQVWAAERERNGDEAADYLCDIKELSASALRVMEDAASQIRNILIGLDFPESALSDKPINFNTDFCPEHAYIGALLTSGLYPNIAYHSEGRRLFTAEGKFALVHKASVNCRKNATFVFPLFTFTEKASLSTPTSPSPIRLYDFILIIQAFSSS